MLDFVQPAAAAVVLVAGLLIPGAVVLLACRLPRTVASCFAGSVLALYVTLLGVQVTGLSISFSSLAGGLLLITFVAGAVARLAPGQLPAASINTGDAWAPFSRMGAWTPWYALFWCIVLWRCVHQPLAGADVEFRWSFLAEQMLRLGTLDFYPADSAADFRSYFWSESIPPGVAVLHSWAYACAGRAAVEWTTPAVVLQLWTVHQLIWLSADRLGGERAARFACLAAAAAPLLTWSVTLGQETGFTALALAGMAYAIVEWERDRASRWIALAGIFATLGAMAREYGLVFPGLLVAYLLSARAGRGAWKVLAPFLLVSVAWPLRTALLTGNPFYSLPVAGLPTNPRFVAWLAHDSIAPAAELRAWSAWRAIVRYFAWYAPLAVLGWSALAWTAARRNRQALGAAIAVVAVLALWLASVPFTNGGLFYSTRVTSPAIALGAIAAGVLFSRVFRHGRDRSLPALMTGIFCVVTLAGTLALPANPLQVPPTSWPLFRPPVKLVTGIAEPIVALLAQQPRVGTILTDAPGLQRRFLPLAVDTIPLWSPGADWLFDRSLSRAEAQRRWRESGVTHVILSRWATNLDFFEKHARMSDPAAHFRLEVVGHTELYAAFALHGAD